MDRETDDRDGRGDRDFTSEAVAAGHPDKVCDRISDAVLDAHLARDPEARVACEAMAMENCVVVAGETALAPGVEPIGRGETEEIVRAAAREIGCEHDNFHWERLEIVNRMAPQSREIAKRVDEEGGAGDQGLMFGYAVDEAPGILMPAPFHCARGILARLLGAPGAPAPGASALGLGPDGKSQATLRYRGGRPVSAVKIVVSVQHPPAMGGGEVREAVSPAVRAELEAGGLEAPPGPEEEWLLVNPSGRFSQGGPASDAGLTGRKIVVDTYGGAAPHGGGAFSGKDPTKVDRSGAYAARWLAKNAVAAGLARGCLIQVSYAIGVVEPCSFHVELERPLRPGAEFLGRVRGALLDALSMRPRDIRARLDLGRPIYVPASSGGHFGRAPTGEGHFPWERTDIAEGLRAALGGG